MGFSWAMLLLVVGRVKVDLPDFQVFLFDLVK